MPKRTNPFQKVVEYIYQQLVPSGFKVTGSAELAEASSGALREVDVYVEGTVAGISTRMAIECRSRNRKDSLQWIDELIGKFVDLEVDKVVAINERGFSETAHRKAKAHGIETLTPEEALETDWNREFTRLGFDLVQLTADPIRLAFHFADQGSFEIPGNEVFSNNAIERDDIRHFGRWVYVHHARSEIEGAMRNEILKIFPTVADLSETKHIRHTQHLETPLEVAFVDGNQFLLTSIEYLVEIRVEIAPKERKFRRLGEAQIESGRIDYTNGDSQEYSFVNIPGSDQVKLILDRPSKAVSRPT